MAQIETRTEPMVINMGPHHPSTHGVLRLVFREREMIYDLWENDEL